MLRWSYIIPRLAVLACLLLVGWLTLDPTLRWTLVHAGQAATGAKVEIEHLHAILGKAEIQLKDVVLADPASPMQNLFESKAAVLDFDTSELLHGRFVVNEGHLGGMRLGTPRRESGAMDAKVTRPGPTLSQRATTAGNAWLEWAGEKLNAELHTNLHSVTLGNALLKRWPQEYRELESAAKSLHDQSQALRETLQSTKRNPTQPFEHYQSLLSKMERFRREAVQVAKEVARLRLQMQTDRDDMEAARAHDWQYLQQQVNLVRLEPEAVSGFLLGPEMAPRVDELVKWLQWSRKQLSGMESPIVDAQRGQDIRLPGMDAAPTMLVRRLLVDGTGSRSGMPFSFVGTLEGLTHQPRRYGKPAVLNLRTSGSQSMLVRAQLDHTGQQRRDTITIECPQLAQGARVLGAADKLAIQVAPANSELRIHVVVVDNALEGTITFHQPVTGLQAIVSEPLGGQLLANRLAPVTAAIHEIQAEAKLSGTLESPRWQLHSSLGSHVAAGVQDAFRAELEFRQRELMQKATAVVDQQLAELQRVILQRQQELLSKLNLEASAMDTLKQQLPQFDLAGAIMGPKGVLQRILR